MDFAAMMRRMLKRWKERVARGDVADLADLLAFSKDVDRAIADAIAAARATGSPEWTWENIGRACTPSVSKQAAEKRWGTA